MGNGKWERFRRVESELKRPSSTRGPLGFGPSLMVALRIQKPPRTLMTSMANQSLIDPWDEPGIAAEMSKEHLDPWVIDLIRGIQT
ncbi:hypothetical protein TIFTF001_006650 [Ficus carica]|uniref:Uncharacterized protein n=1 Tax=Ficus carica TaxID=3494 RepID=A0AA88CW83_FICCA|nr:hypothetical protein TIFTF001_006650 [Ficus carica]